jgi:hypothetical protein
VVTTGQ